MPVLTYHTNNNFSLQVSNLDSVLPSDASSSKVVGADSTTSHHLPVQNSVSSNSPVVPSEIPAILTTPLGMNIPPDTAPNPPNLLLSTAGVFDQSTQSGSSSTDPLADLLDQSVLQPGVVDAFQDHGDHLNQSSLDGDAIIADFNR